LALRGRWQSKTIEALEEGKEVGAGKVLFSDAFIVLFPVKSAKGIFSLTTCPYVINRFFELSGY
jgi:CRISPR-associated protein Cmr4